MLILIYGVTGMCGQALARAALEAGHQVRGSGRTPDKLDKDLAGRLESFVKTESIYDIPALDRAVAGVEAVISAVAPVPEAILEGQLLLLRAAERAGVKIFHGASWNFDWKRISLGDVEIYDPLISFWNHARLTSTITPLYAFTGVILEYMMLHGPGANPISKTDKTLGYAGTGDEECAYITVADLAAYTIHAVSAPDAETRGSYYVESFRCSHRQLATTYAEARGVELEMKCLGTLEGFEGMLKGARATIPPKRFMEYNGLAFMVQLLKGNLDYEPVDSKQWGHIKQTTLREWLDAHPDI
ncbi:hypothetical protein B0T11DRAFT_125264 [Plectosphaerella cucumerina]|uniref:NmrA-like domain-containing protein n=1 Tax=Plectosphaerella cucumerina TaxID=40658 RepID=A0A8K0X080_9PEZI|nr:hypothetical protein B0T11DRAFT_125264 [Plectosphaerella cucumerina]